MLAFGILTLPAGILAPAWPGRTVVILAVLFGVQLVVAGIFGFVAALATDDETGATRVLLALLGVLSFIVGLYALRHILVTIATLALLPGSFWIVNGAIEVLPRGRTVGCQAAAGRSSWGCSAWPPAWWCSSTRGISAVTLVVVLGVWLLVFGTMEVGLAFRLRSVGQGAARIATATAT